jgi:glycosyltransferase involved in cell wall biosynthesis
LQGYRVESIPIPVNTALFKPLDKVAVREKFGFTNDSLYIVFAAMNINDKRKGFAYFVDALNVIKKNNPELSKILKLVVFGKIKDEAAIAQLPFPVISLGFINSQEKISEIFNAVNLFVIPSLEDNLPNIIMESLACGTPVIGFKTGGIPQMIDHQRTGYVADYKSVDDLAKGIAWCLSEADKELLSKQSREKALNYFSEEVVTRKYMDLFNDVKSKFHA